jgi:hypothetical protein
MTILLLILKILGMTLLGILLVLLVLLIWLLCLPFHYRLQMQAPQKEESISDFAWVRELTLGARLESFLGFWQAAIQKDTEGYGVFLYAFWGKWQIYPRKQKQQTKKMSGAANTQDVARQEAQEPSDQMSESQPGEKTTVPKSEKSPGADRRLEKKKSAETDHHFRKKKSAKTSRHAGKKSRQKMEKWDENILPAATFLCRKLLWLLKKIRPRELEADMDFCLGDPSMTGTATGILSLIPACYGKNVRICPDFERDDIYFQGYLDIKGIVFLIHFVYLIISVFFNKNCRKLLQK